MPISVGTSEATFSKLTFNTKLSQKCNDVNAIIRDLALLPIESELGHNVDYEDVIKEFAKTKFRKHAF